MSTDQGGKAVAGDMLAAAKGQFTAAKREAEQLQFLDPLSADELFDARERMGEAAGMVSVMRDAREARRGRPKNSRNRRSDDFARYIGQFGQDPAITLMQIQSTSPEELIARSELVDPAKRRMSYQDAQGLRVRCAEALMPYIHSKKPVAIELGVEGDFNLLIPGLNITQADATRAVEGSFVLEADYLEVEADGGGEDGGVGDA